jgi:hypothetical protein
MNQINIIFLYTLITLLPKFILAQNKPNIEKIDDAVVLIKIYDYQNQYQGHGSGFVIDSVGTIVTNYHVVEGSYNLKVQFDFNGYKETFDVDKILTGNKKKDLATLSIKNPSKRKFSYLKIAKNIPKKGDECWAIGTPDDPNFMNSVSKGLISNIHTNGIFDWTGIMLQMNAEITHGNSGGALINEKGEVVGVTCGGVEKEINNASDIQDNLNATRAQLNFAIWINEIKDLTPLNKVRIVDPNSIPCQLSFYTNSQFSGNVHLYVDGVYLGTFKKYFLNNSTPQCGAEGTITRNLYAGTHTYTVYYANSGQKYYGSINLTPGQCQVFKVNGPTTNNYSYNPYYPMFSRKKIEDKNLFTWAIYSGYSFFPFAEKTNVPKIPIPILIEKSFNENKYSIRSKLEFFNGSEKYTDYYTNLKTENRSSYFSSLFDFKIIWNREFRFNFWTAPTIGYGRLSNYSLSYSYLNNYNPNTGSYVTEKNETNENISGITYGARFGTDVYLTKRLNLSSDFGIINNKSFNSGITVDFNLIIGYKFNLWRR